MWFGTGIVSLILFTIYFARKRYLNNWVGIPAKVGNLVYTHDTKTTDGKVKIKRIYLGCDANVDFDFAVKYENKWDRFFKSIGISEEIQVGDEAFDKRTYVICDHLEICKVLKESKELQQLITDALNAGIKFGTTLSILQIQKGRIWVKLSPGFDNPNATIPNLAKIYIPILDSIVQLFKAKLAGVQTTFVDSFNWKAAGFLAISTAMAITGGVHMFTLSLVREPFLVDLGEFAILGFIVGSLITLGLITSALLVLRRSARTHIVVIELMTAGFFGAISCTLTLTRDLNIEWDRASPTQHVVKVHDVWTKKSRRSTEYYLRTDDWNNPGITETTSIPGKKYRTIKAGDRVIVTQYPGYLNFKWVSDISKYDGDQF